MDLDPEVFFKTLHATTDQKLAEKHLTVLHHILTNDQIEDSFLDDYILNVFNKHLGLCAFIQKQANIKLFSKCSSICFDILYVIINNFPEKIQKYVEMLFDACTIITKSSATTAIERKRAYDVLNVVFEKIPFNVGLYESYKTVYDLLLRCLGFEKSNTVLEKLLIVIGTFSKTCQLIIDNPTFIRGYFLHYTVIGKKCSDPVVYGAFTGLLSFFYNFPLDLENDIKIIEKLYKNIRTLAQTTHSKLATKAALKLFTQYTSLFNKYLVKDSVDWMMTCKIWLDSNNSEDYKVGLELSIAFYSNTANVLAKSECNEVNKNMTERFKKYFLNMLSKDIHNSYQLRISLEGLSAFCDAFNHQLGQEQITKVSLILIETFERNFIFKRCETAELEYLPVYIKAVAQYLKNQKMQHQHLQSLQKSVIFMIKSYHLLHVSYSKFVVEAIVLIFYHLKQQNEKEFDRFVEETLYYGIVWTCSHQHISDADIDNMQVVTIKNYSSFWLELLRIDQGSLLHDDFKTCIAILKKIVEKLITNLIFLTERLNIRFETIDDCVTDPKKVFKLEAEHDYQIFLNLVDFYQEIFEKIHLEKGLLELVEYLVQKCLKYAFVSGFYKLLASSVRICKKLKIFDEDSTEIKQTVGFLVHFLPILLERIEQFTDELLISCLLLLIEFPASLVQNQLLLCIPAFISLITAAKNHYNLLELALDALDIWQKNISVDAFNEFLIQIIPHFDYFLRYNTIGGIVAENVEKRRKGDRLLKKRKIVLESTPELLKLQTRILHFLGQQNCTILNAFVVGTKGVDLAVWGQEPHLKIILPFEDLKIDFYLDRFLPRIIELALNSTDKKLKIGACELLHAVVMVFLGTTKQMSKSQVADLNKLAIHLTASILKLGCDFNPIVRQLFEPLVFQLIHWYTHQSRSDHEAILIDAMLDAVTCSNDPTLRDFAGKCFNEFITWTIKQNTKSSIANDPINVKILVQKMHFFSSHPDSYKKLGAALIFNNIYQELREEKALFSMFWIELLTIFIQCFASIEVRRKNVIEQLNNAILHLQRGFIEKYHLFNKKDKNRRIPVIFNQDANLKGVATWLLTQIDVNNPICRKVCMDFFMKIVVLTPGFTNYCDFVQEAIIKTNPAWFSNINQFLENNPTLVTFHRSIDPNLLLKWLQALLKGLDCLNFVVKNHLVKYNSFSNQHIIYSAKYFINHVAIKSISESLLLLHPGQCFYTIQQEQEYSYYKSEIVLKLMQVVNSYNVQDSICDEIYDQDFLDLIVKLIFNAELLGFDKSLRFELKKQTIFEVLTLYLRRLPKKWLQLQLESIRNFLGDNFIKDAEFKMSYSIRDVNILEGLIFLQSCHLAEFPMEVFGLGIITNLTRNILNEQKLVFDELSKNCVQFWSGLLRFGLLYETEFERLVQLLVTSNIVEKKNHEMLEFSTFIFYTFNGVVCEYLAKNFSKFLNIINNSSQIFLQVEAILNVLNYLEKNCRLRVNTSFALTELFLMWSKFSNYFNTNLTNAQKGLEVVNKILSIKIEIRNQKSVTTWLCSLLKFEHGTEQELYEFKLEVISTLVYFLDEETNEFDLDLFSKQYFLRDSNFDQKAKIIGLNRLTVLIPKVRNKTLEKFILEHCALWCELTELNDFENNLLNCQNDVLCFTIYHVVSSSQLLNQDQKLFLIKKTILLYQQMSNGLLEKFFINIIPEILANLILSTNDINVNQKIFDFMLIELLFIRFPMSKNDFEPSPITLAAGIESNKSFFLKFLQISFDTTKSTWNEENNLTRILKCYSYNCSVSIVMNCIKEPPFYLKLFVRKEGSENVLWNGLIDQKRHYKFASDFQSLPKQKKVIFGFRNSLNLQQKSYLEVSKVYNSSLSEDFTKFDFTESTVRTQEVAESNKGASEVEEVILDLIDVNTHESMPAVCALFHHLKRQECVSSCLEPEDQTAPDFIQGIKILLMKDSTFLNVKFFWIQVIINVGDFFQYFANDFMTPLLKFIVDNCAENDLNYFISDVIGLVASWSQVYQPKNEDAVLINQVLEFLIKNLTNERQDKFKFYLELLKLIVEAWKSVLKVPTSLVLQHFVIGDKKVEVGIHVASILLVNELQPWATNFKELKLVQIIQSTNWRSTYKSAAETIGLSLQFLSKSCSYQLQENINSVYSFLKDMRSSDKYPFILEGIVLHFPEVASVRLLDLVLLKMDSSPTDEKVVFLKVLLKRYDILHEVIEIRNTDWNIYLDHQKFEVQLLTMELLLKCLETFKTINQFKLIVQKGLGLANHSSSLVRLQVYDLAIEIVKDDSNEELLNIASDVLVQGFMDRNSELRLKVRNFWHEAKLLPQNLTLRFGYLLSLYKPKLENTFLGYCSYLLVDVLESTDEINENIFQHALEDCEFENYNLKVDWRIQSKTLLPMFAETFRSMYEQNNTDGHVLRKTQDFRTFAPTQVTQTAKTQLTQSESLLSVDIQHTKFLNPNSILINQKYKKRFLKNKGDVLKHQAQQQTVKMKYVEKKRQDLVSERDQKVVLFRSYRIGDLPDIQITLKSILGPLKDISVQDGEIARILYLELFNGIIKKGKFLSSFYSEIATGIRNILTQSYEYNLTFIKTIFDLLIIKKCEIIMEPELVLNASQASGLLSTGALILEEYLNNKGLNDEDCPSSNKRIKSEVSFGVDGIWLKLSELYKEMEEYDTVQAIFLHKLDCGTNLKDALSAEMDKDWRTAEECYKSLISEPVQNLGLQNFYFEAYLKCLDYLGKWEEVAFEVGNFVDGDASNVWEKLWKDCNHKKLLSCFISSKVKQFVFNDDSIQIIGLLSEINETLQSSDSEMLKNDFAEELAILYMLRDERNEAEQFITHYLKNFLQKWHLIDPSYQNFRFNSLLKLHNIIDLDKYVKVCAINSEDELNAFFDYFDRSSDDKLPSILLTENRILNRRRFMHSFANKPYDFDGLSDRITNITRNLFTNIITTAIEDKNFYIARKYLTLCQNEVFFKLLLTRTRHIAVPFVESGAKQVELLIQCCNELIQFITTETYGKHNLNAHIYLFLYLNELHDIGEINEGVLQNYENEVLNITGSGINNISIAGSLRLKSRLELCDKNNFADELTSIRSAYLQLALFARTRDENNFPLYVLKSMSFGSIEAKQLFPCIIINNLPLEMVKVFISECRNIEIWMFLDWVPQILNCIYSNNLEAIEELVLRISTTFPQAVMYAYRLCKKEDTRERVVALLEKLDHILCKDEKIDIFLKALCCVSIPFTTLSYYLHRLSVYCKLKNQNMFDKTLGEITEWFKNSQNFGNTNSIQGTLYKKVTRFSSKFLALQKKCLDKLQPSLVEIHNELEIDLTAFFSKRNTNILLKDLSPWLVNFVRNMPDSDLEIPGQYDGRKLLFNHYHIRIAGFAPNVQVMTSLRRPIKLTMLGHDGREYPFLIKFGEDLRQDQRIQQLFTLMNDIMASESNRFELIQTYKVVPFNKKLGLIQWINNTEKFGEFILSECKDKYQTTFTEYLRFIGGRTKNDNVEAYHKVAMNFSKSKVVGFYNSLVNVLSQDAIKCFLWKLSNNTESYCTLRNTFIKSYATVCASQWLLGIGDRHLENSLLNLENGSVLGIDFGHAFGTATQILPVPELVPFRLTPQIVNFLQPLGEKGLFRETMLKFLRLMRSKSDCLIATMNVFIQEPSVDWLEHAMRFCDDSNHSWYPLIKIEQAKRKLAGASSSKILIEDLEAGHAQLKALNAYIELVKAERSLEDGLTVEDQVDGLIDHATDYNLLGRMHKGWTSWV